MSIYNAFYTATIDILPQQMISLKEKLAKSTPSDPQKSWGQRCMDALETIGKSQYSSNLKLIENYEMIKGRFIFSHYFHTEGYESMLNQLTAEFELPNYLRHYDIISPVVNTLSGEWQKRPDTFKVVQLGDGATNEYLRVKTDLTKQYVFNKINAEINKKLFDEGIDVNKQDFQSEEEAKQYQQQIEQARQSMTPKEIQKYMDTDFLTQAEIWGQHQYQYDREMFNLPEKEKIEFEDMLIADRAFRHFYLTPTGYAQETWNPMNVFFHKSPDTVYIEDGDYVGRIFNLSINTIIDRYGHLMDKEDFKRFSETGKEDSTQWADGEFNWVYNNYLFPFKGYPAYDIMRSSWNIPPTGTDIPQLDERFYNQLSDDTFFRDKEGYYFVTEAYWKTQKKIIKITYIDEEVGDKVVKIVDENFIIPDFFVESKSIFSEDHEINTYCETWVNEVWKGVKINTAVDKNLKKDLYLDIGPNDFQFKGDLNIYGCKLPVCGQIFSMRNSRSMSIVDMMKPHQIGYNVAMNQLYQLAEKEVGMFVVMDVNMFPNSKDWGGEDNWDKWMLIAKNLGILPADTSPQNIKNSLSATGGFLPKVIDLNLASQMVSRMNMAKFFEEQSLKQVGFNQYRTGDFAASTTATGVQQGQAKSYSQTESLFTNFSNYLRRCNQMGLSMAQYVQSQKQEIAVTYIKGDLNRAFVKILGTDLLLADLGVMVINSQEHMRQLEMIRQFALSNNTSGLTPPDVADIIMMNSPGEIRRQLQVSYSKIMENQQQQQQMQQQQMEQASKIKEAEMAKEDEQFNKQLENNLQREQIRAGASVIASDKPAPMPQDNSDQLSLNRQVASNTDSAKREKIALDKEKTRLDAEYKQKKLAVDQQKIQANLQIQNQQTETARILKGKKE